MVNCFANKKSFSSRIVLLAVLAAVALFLVQCGADSKSGEFDKERLSYKLDALKPYISKEAMELHYNRHYAGYLSKTKGLTGDSPYAGKSLEELVGMTAGKTESAAIFNNAAQAWNHAFYFKCLSPNGGGTPEGPLAKKIDEAFGSFDKFKEAFIAAASGQFGSGWAWLVLKDGKLELLMTANADTPIAHGLVPLLTVDVWEHAYYLDYYNQRSEFVTTVMDKLMNWSFVSRNLTAAK